jgi:hypothetical protein
MSHQLKPKKGSPYLPPDEVVRRLQTEFAIVDADAAAGAQHVADMIKYYEKAKAPPELIAAHRLLQSEAIAVIVADEPKPGDAYLQFVVMPGETLFIGYCSEQNEMAAKPLLKRCCQALGYRSRVV